MDSGLHSGPRDAGRAAACARPELWAVCTMLFDFALDEVGTIRTLLHEELRPSKGVTFKTCRRRYRSFAIHERTGTVARVNRIDGSFCTVFMLSHESKCGLPSNLDNG